MAESMYPESEFRIVAGKFYRRFNDPREKNKFQVLNIEKVHHREGYNHNEGLYAADLAVIIIERYIDFKTYIAPICIDYNLKDEEKVVPAGSIGRVAGWGLEQSNGHLSDKLKVIEVPVINRAQCRQSFDRSFRAYLTYDKFCAGYKDLGIGLCQGDSGGGLVFSKDEGNRKVFYLRGIVSTGPNNHGSCNSNQYTLFTNSAHFSDLIRKHDYANRPEFVDIVPPSNNYPQL